MEIRKSAIIFLAFFLLLSQTLFAQEAEETIETEEAVETEKASYYVEYDENNNPKFFQRLEWERENFVLYYEVLILVDDNGYREYSKDTTEENLLLVSLPPGRYRYSVTPYDLLEIRGETSELKEFVVLTAYQPVIESFAPQVFYLDKNRARILEITGTNLFEESVIYLQKISGSILYPEETTILNNRRATLIFDDMELTNGAYDIFVMNPGGLYARLSGFSIRYGKPLDFFLKLSYAPAIPVYGHLFDIFGPSILPGGLSLSFESISSARGDFNGGIELAASVFFLDPVVSLAPADENNYFPINSLFIPSGTFFTSFDVNIALQRRFNRRRMAFTFRFGLGVAFISSSIASYEWNETPKSYEQDDIIIQLNVGVNFLMRLYQDLCLEVAVDFNNHINPVASGILRPKLGLIWQF